VSLESPSSAASSSAELHSNSTSSFGTTTLHDDDKDHPHSMEVEASSSTSSSESIQFMEVVMDIPLEETLEQHNNNNFDHTFMGHDNDDLMPHISANDELGINQTISPMTLAPYVSISYDEHGMVQADATTTIAAMMASEYQLATISSAQELQQQEQGADYPAFIQALFQKDANGQTLASKLFNLALLAVSFGYVFVSVFNIDRGMTRGWSPAEIGMRIPLDTWASYENSLSEKPVATKTIINIVIYLLGDWLSQTLFQRKDILDFDAARTLKNGLVGMCFGPAVHEYYEFSDWILPVEGLTLGITNRAFKILMDQTIYLSVKCSIYIIAVGLLNGESVENGTENVKNRLKPIMFTAWKFWPLVHCVTYGLIPARHRILWVNSVDLVWNAILASKARGDDDTTTVAKEESESPPGGGVGGLADKVEDAKENIFNRLGAMFSKFDPPQHQVGEDDDTTTIIVAGNLVEDDIIVASGETMPTTNTSDTMPVLAKNE
jgi:protein Mpv17